MRKAARASNNAVATRAAEESAGAGAGAAGPVAKMSIDAPAGMLAVIVLLEFDSHVPVIERSA
jgi:hypothetical protein